MARSLKRKRELRDATYPDGGGTAVHCRTDAGPVVFVAPAPSYRGDEIWSADELERQAFRGAWLDVTKRGKGLRVTTIGETWQGTFPIVDTSPDADERIYVAEFASRSQDCKALNGRVGETWHGKTDARPFRTSTGFDSIQPRI